LKHFRVYADKDTPDCPCGGKQNQWKSFPAVKLRKNWIEKLDLPVKQ
jgi:hypothetical protein